MASPHLVCALMLLTCALPGLLSLFVFAKHRPCQRPRLHFIAALARGKGLTPAALDTIEHGLELGAILRLLGPKPGIGVFQVSRLQLVRL